MTVLALPDLYDKVKAFFEEEEPDLGVAFAFGWKAPQRQDAQGGGRGNRIVFVPGDATGALGMVAAVKYPGRNPRSLATLNELFTVYVWGWDASKEADELAQYTAARLLYDAWYRAMYHVAHGVFQVVSQAWVNPTATRGRGAELQVVCTISAVIPDTPYPQTGGDVTPSITTSIGLPGGDEPGCSM